MRPAWPPHVVDPLREVPQRGWVNPRKVVVLLRVLCAGRGPFDQVEPGWSRSRHTQISTPVPTTVFGHMPCEDAPHVATPALTASPWPCTHGRRNRWCGPTRTSRAEGEGR